MNIFKFLKLVAILALVGIFPGMGWGASSADYALLDGVSSCNPSKVKNAIKDGANVNIQVDELKNTPLMLLMPFSSREKCKKKKGLQIAESLLKAGANPNAYNTYGDTALTILAYGKENAQYPWVLVKKGDKIVVEGYNQGSEQRKEDPYGAEMAQLLLNYGADRSVINLQFYNALMLAANARNRSIANVLKRSPNDLNTALYFASAFTDPVAVEELILLGANVNAVLSDKEHGRFLDGMVWRKEEQMSFKTKSYPLVGADTPLLVAVASEELRGNEGWKEETVKKLLKYGANVNCLSTDNESVVSLAIQNGNVRVFDAVMSARPRLDLPTDTTLFYDALLSDDSKIDYFFQALLAKGANINMRNSKGETPLMDVAARENLDNPLARDSVQRLLDAGADKTLKNKEGKTAYDIAMAECRKGKRACETSDGKAVLQMLRTGSSTTQTKQGQAKKVKTTAKKTTKSGKGKTGGKKTAHR